MSAFNSFALPMTNNQNQYSVVDTIAPFEHFAKNGYYTVGNKIFNHKIHALQEATRIKQDPK